MGNPVNDEPLTGAVRIHDTKGADLPSIFRQEPVGFLYVPAYRVAQLRECDIERASMTIRNPTHRPNLLTSCRAVTIFHYI